ncbi:MAG: restriction endonuclease subunit S [Elusimicrobiales bacterium]|nr:restriction endonuclease subunit S [Elusimicrobiales bacterium]
MKNQWNQYKLRDILTLQYGEGLSKNKRILGEYPVYGSGGIVGYHKESLAKGPGIIVGRKGSIGSVFYEKKDFYPIDTVFYVELRSSQYSLRYVYYLLVQSNLKNLNTDAAVPGLNREVAHSQIVKIPDFLLQNKISSILSAYDDLIENNTRRIQILEEMSQRIYREWFVDFRFPGHEKVKFVDSELGKIPEGWEVKSIMQSKYWDFINENVSEYNGKKEYFATANIEGIDIVKDGILVSYQNKPSRAQKQPVVFSVWFARMKDTYKVLGFTKVNEDIANKSILSSGFAGFKTNEFNFSFIYLTINSNEFHQKKDQYCTGATQMSLTNDGLQKIKIIEPTKNTIEEFGKLILPLLNKIFAMQKINKVLRTTRDLLLPKLISGELDVSDMDIRIRKENS